MGGWEARYKTKSKLRRERGEEGGLTFAFRTDKFIDHKKRNIAMPGVALTTSLIRREGGREGGREGRRTFVLRTDKFLSNKKRNVAMPRVTLTTGLVRFCDGNWLLLPREDHGPF